MQPAEQSRFIEQVFSQYRRALTKIRISAGWKDAVWVFTLSRLVIIVVTFIGTGTVPLVGALQPPSTAVRLQSWYHFDAFAYVYLAWHGYTEPKFTAFFPLWPLLIHILGTPFGGSVAAYYYSGLILANVFFFFVLVLFHRLISLVVDPSVARAGLLYLAFYPYAIFFFAGYTESLFLLLCLAIFLLLQSQKMRYWWLAGLLGFLATLTRSIGIVLMVPFLIVALQRYWLGMHFYKTSWWQKLHALAPMLIVPLGLVTYMVYLGVTKGNLLLFSSVESQWQRHLELPWYGILRAFAHIYHLGHVIPAPGDVENVLDVTFTLIPLIALVVGWKRLPLHYSLFGVAVALFALSFPSLTPYPLMSMPRYLMMIFPIFIVFALWGKHPRFDRFYLATTVALFAVNIVLFTTHRWVA